METITLNVKGMTCMGCVQSVRNVLAQISGVSSVEIILDQGRATVTYDPAQADAAQFKAAIHDAGFEVVA